jgi:hypothetical protein
MLHVLLTEMKKEKDEEYYDDIKGNANVRATDLEKDFGPFWTFFDKLSPHVVRVKVWSVKVKIANTVTDSGCMTITDEAFTILALENYWGRWFHGQPTQWSDSRHGKQQFMGWSDEANDCYDMACKLIVK